MFTANVSHEGETFRVPNEIVKLIQLFESVPFALNQNASTDLSSNVTTNKSLIFNTDKAKSVNSEEPLNATDENDSFVEEVIFEFNMDQSNEKCSDARMVPMPKCLVNNPSISIIPAKSPQTLNSPSRQPQRTSISMLPRATPVTTPSAVVPVSNEQSVINDKLVQSSAKNKTKRNALNQDTDLSTFKVPRLSKTPDKRSRTSNKSCAKNEQTSKVNHPSKPLQVPTTKSLCSVTNVINIVAQSGAKQLSTPISDLKKDTVTNETEKNINVKVKSYELSVNGPLIKEDGGLNMKGKSEGIFVYKNNQIIDITKPDLVDNLLLCVGAGLKRFGTKEEYDIAKQSNIIHSPEHSWWSTDSENVSTTNSKQSPVNSNNIVTQKSPQAVNQTSHKSPSPHIGSQHPSTSKHPSVSVTLQQMKGSPNVFSPQGQPKQNDVKMQLSSNQLVTSPKATITQTQLSSKQQVLNSSQSSSPSKLTMATVNQVKTASKQTAGQPLAPSKLQPAENNQPTVKTCSKCGAEAVDDLCTTCRVSSQFKGVTVTRIETPATPISSSVGSVILLSSEDEDDGEINSNEDTTLPVEPIVSRVDSMDLINEYVANLRQNPLHLEDKLLQIDLSSKDFFKIENCYSIRIGNFKTTPSDLGDTVVCLHGVRITLNDADSQPVTLDLRAENIVKILAFYGDKMPTIIIYTTHLASAGIRHLLGMRDDGKGYFYDPTFRDNTVNKIILSFGLKKNENTTLEKLLQRFPKGKYEPVTTFQVNKLISAASSVDKQYKKKVEKTRNMDYNNTEIINFNADNNNCRVSIFDFTGLSVDEYLNDALVDFYLNYWFMRHVSEKDRRRSYLFSTFFYTRLTTPIGGNDKTKPKAQCRHDRVKKWTKNVNIFEKDFIFVPINENYHWYMAVVCYPYLTGPIHMETGSKVDLPDIDRFEPDNFHLSPCAENSERDEVDGNSEDLRYFHLNYDYYDEKETSTYESDVEELKKSERPPIKQPCILIFDSLYGGTNRANIVATLREYLAEEYYAKNGERREFPKEIVKGSAVKVPQQTNYSDCGLFLLHYFEKFFECPIVDYSCPISHLEHWFSCDDVTKNAKKRKDFLKIVLKIMEEQGRKVELPTLKFVSTNNSSGVHYRSYNPFNHDYDSMDYEENMDSEDSEMCDEEDYMESDEEYVNPNYDYEDEDEEDGYDHDPTDFYPEHSENEDETTYVESAQWSDVQHEDGIEYHTENIGVDVDEPDVNPNNHGNVSHQNNEHLDSYRSAYVEHENISENISAAQSFKSKKAQRLNHNK
ncbi:uncharacterized protein LOC126840615 [Adelges cooleyi]|uniref:uncharacterized protein LOC126840615 n=1 Tax=Adelges cooleyi TaxID=133065 RepID=UPI0021803309|nr:uncharacterized protein LOC126840615 [Adelges cooleyi]